MPKNYRYLDRTRTIMTFVKEYKEVDETKFKDIVKEGEPAVIRKIPFGECTYKWTLDYLTDAIGDEEVVIHESKDHYCFNFITKSFCYKRCKFSEFAERVGDKFCEKAVYLRSTNKDPRSKKPARIEDDFPVLAKDLQPPSFIPYGKDDDKYHSSVLRISSRYSRLWMHFDLYDNVLCQVIGVKTVYLFPPTDSKCLYLDGDKSLVQEMDDWFNCTLGNPALLRSNPLEVHLHPGDCLFIPSMWWHQILNHEEQSKSYSIGFNIFWKDETLERANLYAPNDVYGNKNLRPYDAALANLDQAMKHLEKLPDKYGQVYKEMFYREVEKRVGRR